VFFIPNQDRVLIEPDQAKEKTAGGIIIPDNIKDKERPLQGTVRAVGLGRITEDGVQIPVQIRIGTRVAYPKMGGVEVEINGKTHILAHEKDVLGTFCEDQE
jgi:chaperonin GroES